MGTRPSQLPPASGVSSGLPLPRALPAVEALPPVTETTQAPDHSERQLAASSLVSRQRQLGPLWQAPGPASFPKALEPDTDPQPEPSTEPGAGHGCCWPSVSEVTSQTSHTSPDGSVGGGSLVLSPRPAVAGTKPQRHSREAGPTVGTSQER